ncbi:MAG: DEAD/DEAH box helicase [Elusimicrobiota bacterium]
MGFSRFNLSPTLFQSITALGYAEPTPIQAHAIPEALKGKDIRACAQTGTGKTCAFIIPIVEKLIQNPPTQRPSALILTPTRELAAQVVSVANSLVKGTRLRTALVLGGANSHLQAKELRAGVDIVVATPGRLIDHVEQGSVSLKNIHTLILDEADRMLDMGFLPSIRRIISFVPVNRQTMLFSATFGAEIKQLTNQFLKNPAVVDLSPSSSATSENVTQMAYPVRSDQKRALLQALLELGNMTSALIFTRTKHGADKLYRTLQDLGKKTTVIHANRSQSQRQQALQGFKDRRYQILVATDIAARGIDVKDISHVINYDVPRHCEDYVHRIGRTGRAQSVGEAFTLVSPEEEVFLKRIENFIRKPIPRSIIPDFPYQSKPRMFNEVKEKTSHSRPFRSKGASHGGFPKKQYSEHSKQHQSFPPKPSQSGQDNRPTSPSSPKPSRPWENRENQSRGPKNKFRWRRPN